MKFSRIEEMVLWIIHNNNSILYPCLTIDEKILRFSSILHKAFWIFHLLSWIFHKPKKSTGLQIRLKTFASRKD